uniref:protein-tyrosine-phosphatase n=1 Tax=Panagrolaimus superbus TaxID=310955 RepID=A0A914YU92_9BILA
MNRGALISAFAEFDRRNQWIPMYNKLGIETSKQESELGLTAEESFKEINFPKNRYQNVLPYDQNRVLLNNVQEGNTNFLNASPLLVPFANRDYILTQGPLETTAEDFWQMVWEQNSRIIVMLNNIMEKGSIKCYHYFVDNDEKEKTFGNFSIKMEEERGTGVYRIRTIKLTALDKKFLVDDEESTRTISHFHYINWPDFGVPNETRSFLEFLEKTNQAQILLKEEKIESPVIVHCSAGIGRSGAYVIVDCVLNYLQKGNQSDSAAGDTVEVPKSIDELVIFIRRHRMGLIQTPEQLRFCWKAIVDWLKAHPEENGNGDDTLSASSSDVAVTTNNDPSIISPNPTTTWLGRVLDLFR